MNSGDLLAELLIAHGMEYVFGAIGGQGYPLNDALHRRRSKARHIAVRDERSSAYARRRLCAGERQGGRLRCRVWRGRAQAALRFG